MKVLIVGLGSIGQRHVRNLREILGQDVDIHAMRSRGLEHVLDNRQQITSPDGLLERYGIRAFSDLDDALAEQPTAVFVCNPNSMHLPVAMAAAQAGCHLFIEKPLSHSVDGIDALVQIVSEKNLAALVGYQLRFHPCVQTVQALLRDERIGRIVAARVVDAEYLPDWHPYEDYRESYAARRALGGGTILARIHEMDYLYGFFGLPSRVMTIGGHLSDLEIDVEDVASSLFEFGEAQRRFPVHLHQDMVSRRAKRSCDITGDAGHIEMDLLAGTVRVRGKDGLEEEIHDFRDLDRNQLFLDELRHFLACVDGDAEPVVTLRDGAESLRMAVAAQQSLETRAVVELS
jgi:predicted dehydrogenase